MTYIIHNHDNKGIETQSTKLSMAEISCLAAAHRLRSISNSLRNLLANVNRGARTSNRTNSTASAVQTSTAPKQQTNIRHIRENATLYEKNCIDRNYKTLSNHSHEIVRLFQSWKTLQYRAKSLRQRNNGTLRQMKDGAALEAEVRKMLLDEAVELKSRIGAIEQEERTLEDRMQELAAELPNLTSEHTPIGSEPKVLAYINQHPDMIDEIRKTVSHTTIGSELDLLDFAAASTTSGWGFYYLKNEAALLEQALVQYALKTAREHGFQVISPPSLVYSHISSACGFRPRDNGGEQQVYAISQDEEDKSRPGLSLAGTAEIPFAAMKASQDMDFAQLPIRVVGSSRCYRAEAGSRGIDTKGLYRVHEFTKVEMFGWTMPDGTENDMFHLMITIQKQILESLGLHCRILEQPSQDLGASAIRKQDIEAFFPSRRQRNDGWGELTSTSICTDYQSRRLATRVRHDGKFIFPYTVNGTALAVPRVIAAILENHWDAGKRVIRIPEVLWPWMHGIHVIGP